MSDAAETFDVIGVGAGPSNLALAVAVDERNRSATPMSMTIFERKPSFGWHPDMLLDGATMQISFLKDLVTLRNPQSDFGFLAYLHDRGRLVDFVNHQTFFPTRVEFTDYLSWVADRVEPTIEYSTEVVGLERVTGAADGARFTVRVHDRDGERSVRARSVVVAAGLRQRMPDWATRGPRVFHNHELLTRLDDLANDPEPEAFLVVGGGQSAAEVARHLHTRFPSARIECAINGYGFQPADDSPYANRVFDPQAVDDFYYAADDVRMELMIRHSTTNYGCVDLELINELYAIEYQEKVVGARRLFMLPATEVFEATADSDAVTVTLRSRLSERTETRRFAAVVCATGFDSVGATELLERSGMNVEDATVDREYRQVVSGDAVPGLYVQGATEATHGLASTLLSNVGVRAGEILATLLADTTQAADRDGAADGSGQYRLPEHSRAGVSS